MNIKKTHNLCKPLAANYLWGQCLCSPIYGDYSCCEFARQEQTEGGCVWNHGNVCENNEAVKDKLLLRALGDL